ncbi:MAG TPA: hypothetical protein VHM25_04645, partial [Polyangiaceae bacterium]|nr:hypothetical protein [Polyangiaceae bacterium]
MSKNQSARQRVQNSSASSDEQSVPPQVNTSTPAATTSQPEHQDGSDTHADVALDTEEFHEAFQRVKSEITSIAIDDLAAVNLDVRAVVTTILGAYPRIAALRDELATLGKFDPSLVDKLADYALALGHAHTLFTMSTNTTDDLAAAAAEGIAVRDQLRTDASALAKRGWVSQEFLNKLQNGVGYRSIAF